MQRIVGQLRSKVHFVVLGVLILAVMFLLYTRRESRPETPHDLLPELKARNFRAFQVGPGERTESSCYRVYQSMFDDGLLEILVSFGYRDARPARFVGDRYERAMIVPYLLGKCRPGFHACGFDRDQEDADLFVKEIKGPAGRKAQVRVWLIPSSVGPDDEENRERDLLQIWQSDYAESRFLEGLKTADVVFYNGHSRDGGGPDFKPPRLLKDDHVDYYWYFLRKPGLKKTMESLNGEKHARLLGLFSCVSDRLFAKKILQAASEIGLITSPKLIYYTEALRNLIGALSGIVGQFCESDLREVIRADHSRSSRLEGFFKD